MSEKRSCVPWRDVGWLKVAFVALIYNLVPCLADSESNLNDPYVQLSCQDHGDCSALRVPSYCHVGNSPLINQETDNVCIGCWACCLYSDVYKPLLDICPPSCNCDSVGTLCTSSDDCAAGFFCEILNSNCQPCHRCSSDAVVSGGGTCADHCPYGATGPLAPLLTGVANITQSFDYHAFFAHDLFLWYLPEQQVTPVQIDLVGFQKWLSGKNVQSAELRAEYLFSKLDTDASGFVDVPEYVSKRVLDAGEFLCHAPEDVSSEPIAFPGCPCNAIESPALGACPAGYVCSFAADSYTLTAGDNPYTFLTDTTARCIPCSLGEYCPQGTFGGPLSSALTYSRARQCPAGFYCPSPAKQIPCSAGTYCIEGSVEEYTCSFTDLVYQDALAEVPSKPTTVVELVYLSGAPLAGNYCPEGSSTPAENCVAGYYCPTVSQRFECPEGSFCPEQSVAPRECPWLTSCPAGTERPTFSAGVFVFVILAALITLLSYLYVMRAGRLQAKQAALAGEQELMNMVKTLLVRVTRTYEKSTTHSRSILIEPMVKIEFKGVGMSLKGSKKILLENVSGIYNPGQMHAIMGPSGSGKTTFLNALSGKAHYANLSGWLRYNGQQMEPLKVKTLVGYVPQDDIVHEDLTVYENIRMAYALRGGFKEAQDGKAVVDEVIDDFFLTRVKHSLIGSVVKRGISGGQRKRVNIALEVVGMPSILYLDEPTSGLDASSSFDALRALSRMASFGMNIIMVIHQPRYTLYELFDSLLLLGVGGVTVYNGPPLLTERWFSKNGFSMPSYDNMADFNLDVISGKVPKEGEQDFKKEDLAHLWEVNGANFISSVTHTQNDKWRDSFRLPPEVRNKLFTEFTAVDEDNSNALDAAELSVLFKKLGLAVLNEVLENITHSIGDEKGQVTFEQLMTALEGTDDDAEVGQGTQESTQGRQTMRATIQPSALEVLKLQQQSKPGGSGHLTTTTESALPRSNRWGKRSAAKHTAQSTLHDVDEASNTHSTTLSLQQYSHNLREAAANSKQDLSKPWSSSSATTSQRTDYETASGGGYGSTADAFSTSLSSPKSFRRKFSSKGRTSWSAELYKQTAEEADDELNSESGTVGFSVSLNGSRGQKPVSPVAPPGHSDTLGGRNSHDGNADISTNLSTGARDFAADCPPFHEDTQEVTAQLMGEDGDGTSTLANSVFSRAGGSRSWTLSSVDSVPVVDQLPSAAECNTTGNGEAEESRLRNWAANASNVDNVMFSMRNTGSYSTNSSGNGGSMSATALQNSQRGVAEGADNSHPGISFTGGNSSMDIPRECSGKQQEPASLIGTHPCHNQHEDQTATDSLIPLHSVLAPECTVNFVSPMGNIQDGVRATDSVHCAPGYALYDPVQHQPSPQTAQTSTALILPPCITYDAGTNIRPLHNDLSTVSHGSAKEVIDCNPKTEAMQPLQLSQLSPSRIQSTVLDVSRFEDAVSSSDFTCADSPTPSVDQLYLAQCAVQPTSPTPSSSAYTAPRSFFSLNSPRNAHTTTVPSPVQCPVHSDSATNPAGSTKQHPDASCCSPKSEHHDPDSCDVTTRYSMSPQQPMRSGSGGQEPQPHCDIFPDSVQHPFERTSAHQASRKLGQAVAEGVNFAEDGNQTGQSDQSVSLFIPPPQSPASGSRRRVYTVESSELTECMQSNQAFDSTQVSQLTGASRQPAGAYMQSNKAFDISARSNPSSRTMLKGVPENDGAHSATVDESPTFGSNSLTKQFGLASSGKSVTAATMRKALAQSGNLDDSLFGDIHEAISDKAPPSQLLQFLIIVQRTCIKRFREFYPTIVIDICLLLATACVVGAIHGTEWKLQDVPGNAVMAQTAVATLTGVTFLRTFTKDQTVYWRESSNGLATLPYFLGSSFVDMSYIIIAPMIFVGAYWHLTLPSSPTIIYYLSSLAAVWWSSGVAYAISGMLPSGSTLIATVFICMVTGAFLSGTQPTIADTRGGVMGWVLSISYTRWSMEATTITEVLRQPDHLRNQNLIIMKVLGVCEIDKLYLDNSDGVLDQEEATALIRLEEFEFSQCDGLYWQCFLWIAMEGLLFRIIAFLALHFGNRSKKV